VEKFGIGPNINFEDWNSFKHNLNRNEDTLKKELETEFEQNDIWNIIHQRRRLQNAFGNYFGSPSQFFFTFYAKETWHYINLSDHQKYRLEELLKAKESAHFDLWQENGRTMLKTIINKTNLFLCAEDLGQVDPYIPQVLAELQIPGIDIIRWSQTFKKENQRQLAVLTTSTHDTSSLSSWWQTETDHATKYRFLNEFLNDFPDTVSDELPKEKAKQILLDMYQAPVLFIIHPFWEILHIFYDEPDKRINKPGFSDPTNWRHRMEKPIEDYLAITDISAVFREKISESNRISRHE